MATKKKAPNALTNEIIKHETGLDKDPENFEYYGQLIELLLRDGNIVRAKILLEQGRAVNKKRSISVESRYDFACACVSVWRSDRYTKKDTVRLDVSAERKEMLYGAEDVLIALANGDASTGPFQQRVMAKLAFVKVQLSRATNVDCPILCFECLFQMLLRAVLCAGVSGAARGEPGAAVGAHHPGGGRGRGAGLHHLQGGRCGRETHCWWIWVLSGAACIPCAGNTWGCCGVTSLCSVAQCSLLLPMT